ncbi:preprotein translocase subunit YajC [bacterium]|nr:preprotein translocase subunit YajC [bacterium]
MNQLLLMMGASGQQQQGGSLLAFLPLIAIIVVMYFFMIRPQAKKQKEHQKMLSEIVKGDRILTAGGIVGTIAGIKEQENLLIVKIADNVKIEVSRNSIAQVLKKNG